MYQHGKTIYLGAFGSPESKVAYARFVAEYKQNQEAIILKGEPGASINELGIAFLGHVQKTRSSAKYGKEDYTHCFRLMLLLKC